MRRFADTLPTLRDSQSREAPPQAGFEADAILKILGATPRAGRYRPAPAAPSDSVANAEDVAGYRPPRAAPPSGAAPHPRSVQDAIPPIDTGAAAGTDAGLDEAKAEARARVEEEITAAVAGARAEADAAAAATLEAERTRWAETLAATLSTQLDQALEALHERIATATAAALAPILEEEMTAKAVARFSERLDGLLARESPARAVVVKGPQPLIDALGEVRSGKTPSVQLVASEDAELTVRINDTSLRTTIGMWAGTLTNSSGLKNGKK